MPRLLFDSDDPHVLLQPFLAGCSVATYADLLTPSLVKQFGPRLIVIDRGHGDPLGLATVADIEPGLLSVAAGAAKVHQWLSEKRPGPTAYHDRADWAAVSSALAGTSARHWVSTLDATCSPNGQRPAAVQILGADHLGFHADLSVVWDDTWHAPPAAVQPAEITKLRQLAVPAMANIRPLIAYIESL
jgi:hypothetical protein